MWFFDYRNKDLINKSHMVIPLTAYNVYYRVAVIAQTQSRNIDILIPYTFFAAEIFAKITKQMFL